MGEVKREREFNVSADEMWSKIGIFTEIGWLPGVEAVEVLEDGGKRKLSLGGGMSLVETLLETGERSYTYTIAEGPIPVDNYNSTLSVRPVTETSCVVDWVATFDTPDGTPAELGEQLIGGLYDAALNGLEQGLH